jgi:hypothetical protein
MESNMKAVLILGFACLLCACSAAPVMHTSINGYTYSSGPTSANDPRMRDPHFYMDESSESPAWMKAAPQTNR